MNGYYYIERPDGTEYFICRNCGRHQDAPFEICPDCGADSDERKGGNL
jgi:rubrerythrin